MASLLWSHRETLRVPRGDQRGGVREEEVRDKEVEWEEEVGRVTSRLLGSHSETPQPPQRGGGGGGGGARVTDKEGVEARGGKRKEEGTDEEEWRSKKRKEG